MGITYAALVAGNLRAARARARLSQPQVARRMKALGFGSWSSGKVSECERAERAVQLAELLALALTLECTITEIVSTPATDMSVDFPNGMQISVTSVRNLSAGYRDFALIWGPEDRPAITRPANAYSAMAHDRLTVERR
jgi:transcriptional regulator with XRE-family HTH domain